MTESPVELKKRYLSRLDDLPGHLDVSEQVAGYGAVACGASILERHFTDNKERPGPDIECSMDIAECADLIIQSKRMAKMRGGKKGAVQEEEVTIDFAYASVVTIKDIKKGDVFSEDNLWVKRPGTGELQAEDFEGLMGKTALEDIANDVQLKKAQVEE